VKKNIWLWTSILILGSCAAPEINQINLVLDWSINTNHTGAFVAQDLGYFQKEGLHVQILTPPETGAVGALLSEKAQFIYSYQEEVTLSGASGQDVIALAAVLQNNTSGFASPVGKNILRPKDFEGKVYGGWGSPMEEAVLKALMETDGGDFSKLKMVNMGSMDYFAAVKSSVDFAWIFEGWTGVEAKLRGENLNYIDLGKSDPQLNYYTPVIATRGKWSKENPEIAKKFLRALSKGYEYASQNPQLSAAILLKATPELSPELVKASQDFLSPRYKSENSPWGTMSLDRWTGFTTWLTTRNLLETPKDPSLLFTNEYLP